MDTGSAPLGWGRPSAPGRLPPSLRGSGAPLARHSVPARALQGRIVRALVVHRPSSDAPRRRRGLGERLSTTSGRAAGTRPWPPGNHLGGRVDGWMHAWMDGWNGVGGVYVPPYPAGSPIHPGPSQMEPSRGSHGRQAWSHAPPSGRICSCICTVAAAPPAPASATRQGRDARGRRHSQPKTATTSGIDRDRKAR